MVHSSSSMRIMGNPAPGFRLGLPILQQRFFNSATGIYAYMMVTSSGSRVELRQVGSSNIYESQDSTYTQLDVSDPGLLVLRTYGWYAIQIRAGDD